MNSVLKMTIRNAILRQFWCQRPVYLHADSQYPTRRFSLSSEHKGPGDETTQRPDPSDVKKNDGSSTPKSKEKDHHVDDHQISDYANPGRDLIWDAEATFSLGQPERPIPVLLSNEFSNKAGEAKGFIDPNFVQPHKKKLEEKLDDIKAQVKEFSDTEARKTLEKLDALTSKAPENPPAPATETVPPAGVGPGQRIIYVKEPAPADNKESFPWNVLKPYSLKTPQNTPSASTPVSAGAPVPEAPPAAPVENKKTEEPKPGLLAKFFSLADYRERTTDQQLPVKSGPLKDDVNSPAPPVPPQDRVAASAPVPEFKVIIRQAPPPSVSSQTVFPPYPDRKPVSAKISGILKVIREKGWSPMAPTNPEQGNLLQSILKQLKK
ncbi:unnamed protein product [Cyprideis torosa]|uniref:Uncharacterized protein n=1 Tax=Cyprideis torosa TaxID=163714 RepID=A0A7R8W5L6_9CRUS|nr:unnamed protein product [Cyprideis torosa]CAG0885376.1 unnamed protein product [Cyprideis torosa]